MDEIGGLKPKKRVAFIWSHFTRIQQEDCGLVTSLIVRTIRHMMEFSFFLQPWWGKDSWR